MVLVTGGTGFVGSHCILQLLQQGYKVRTTIRSLSKKDKVINMLREGGINSCDAISFVEADLTSDANWDDAASGCDYVLHVASPIFLRLPETEDEMIKPAVEGTQRVLQAAKAAGVKRVVMTSSFAAVGYSHKDRNSIITEESWTDPFDKSLSAYVKSKAFAERAAWDFVHTNGAPELSVINPVAIFGPSLGPDLSSGFEVLKRMLEGTVKAVPKVSMCIVDVRDVADIHLKAMVHPRAVNQRFLALAGGVVSMHDIAVLLKNTFTDRAKKVPTRVLPDWLVRIAALFSKEAKAVVPMLNRIKNASNEKAQSLLDWHPRSNEEAITASVECLFKYGVIKS